jgi:SAM-dependent methyltransferase
MRTKSTSFHSLSADKGLNRFEQTLWTFFNQMNNRFFPNAFGSLNVRDFAVDLSEKSWKQTYLKSSPSRKLSDLFWMQLPWDAIQEELGPLHILDIGCGSGNYFPRLQMFSGQRVASYMGIDISSHENWEMLRNKYSEVQFKVLNSNDIQASIPRNTNLIISQSALEHFQEDMVFFDQIREFIRRSSQNALQIHLLPSSACLKLYGFHGVRQYTLRSLYRIAKRFSSFSHIVVFRLGGNNCNRLHWDFITQPLLAGKPDLRDTETERYDRELHEAIRLDNQQPQSDPGFYALVIHSNFNKSIFSQM